MRPFLLLACDLTREPPCADLPSGGRSPCRDFTPGAASCCRDAASCGAGRTTPSWAPSPGHVAPPGHVALPGAPELGPAPLPADPAPPQPCEPARSLGLWNPFLASSGRRSGLRCSPLGPLLATLRRWRFHFLDASLSFNIWFLNCGKLRMTCSLPS